MACLIWLVHWWCVGLAKLDVIRLLATHIKGIMLLPLRHIHLLHNILFCQVIALTSVSLVSMLFELVNASVKEEYYVIQVRCDIVSSFCIWLIISSSILRSYLDYKTSFFYLVTLLLRHHVLVMVMTRRWWARRVHFRLNHACMSL